MDWNWLVLVAIVVGWVALSRLAPGGG